MQRSKQALFDHRVGAGEQRGRNGQSERLGGLEIDDKLEFCWLPDYWQLTRLLRARLVQPNCRRTGEQRDKVAPPKRNELHETPNSQSEF